MIESAVDALIDPMMAKGLVAGFIVLALGIVLWLVRGRDEVQRFGGLMVATAIVLVLYQSQMLGWSQVVGVILLAVAGLLHRSVAVGALLALPGAFFIIRPETAQSGSWLPWFGLLAIILAAPIVAAFEGRYASTGLSHPLFGIAALGVFLTVPDTEGAMVLLGVAGVAGFLGWPRAFASLGGAGSHAAVGVYVFVATQGAIGRPASIIASVAVLGLLLIVPIAIRLRGVGLAGQLDQVDAVFPLLAQLALAILIARTAGRVEGVVGGAVLTIGLLAIAGVILVSPRSTRRPRLPDEGP